MNQTILVTQSKVRIAPLPPNIAGIGGCAEDLVLNSKRQPNVGEKQVKSYVGSAI